MPKHLNFVREIGPIVFPLVTYLILAVLNPEKSIRFRDAGPRIRTLRSFRNAITFRGQIFGGILTVLISLVWLRPRIAEVSQRVTFKS